VAHSRNERREIRARPPDRALSLPARSEFKPVAPGEINMMEDQGRPS